MEILVIGKVVVFICGGAGTVYLVLKNFGFELLTLNQKGKYVIDTQEEVQKAFFIPENSKTKQEVNVTHYVEKKE